MLLIVLGAGLFFACTAWQFNQRVQALTPAQKKVLIIGHAGRAFFSPLSPFNPLPPNSRASLLKALNEDGADGLEVDVHVSQDGVPILYHDVSLETMSAGRGKIEDLPAAAVLGVAYKGGWFYDLFHAEKIIALEELLQALQQDREYPPLHLDLRSYTPARRNFFARSVLQLLQKYQYPLPQLSLVYPQPDLLLAFRQLEPRLTLLLDVGRNFDAALPTVLTHQLHGLVAEGKYLTAAQMQTARQRNLQVVLFGGKARATIYQMLLLQPDAIEVNNVKAMRAMVR